MRTLSMGLFVALAMSSPAPACSLAVGTPGTLALDVGGTALASNIGVGLPATATVIVPILQGVTVEVAGPTRVQSPGGYNPSAESVQVAYTANALLGQVASQGFTASTTSFPAAAGVLSALTISLSLHNRILNANGFASGSYMTRTVITCRP